MISLDTLRFLRKKKFWIAFSGVLILAFMIFANLSKNETSEYRALHALAIQYKNKNVMSVPYEESYAKVRNEVISRFEQSVVKKDWQTVNASMRDLFLMESDRISLMAESENPELYYHNYLLHKDEIDTLMKERNLPRLTKNILPDGWYYEGNLADQTPMYPYYQFTAQFYDELEQQNIDQLTYSTVDSSTVFIQFIRVMFPLLPIIIIAMMCYDSLQEDKDSGVVKVLLSQPIKRSSYIRKKLTTNIKAVLFIFLVPLFTVSLGYGLFDHYKTIQAPVLANAQGIASVELMENTLPEIERSDGNIDTLGVTQYFSVPYRYNSPNIKFEFMAMWQFVLLVIVMAVFVLIFIVLLNMLIVVLVGNKIAALAISLIVLLAGMFISRPSNVNIIFAFLPFTYMNPVNILSGYSTYTYLNGMLVLLVSDLLLYLIIMSIYKKRDVIC